MYAIQHFLNLDAHQTQNSPLFCIGQCSQQAFTCECVVQRLQNLALIAGLGTAYGMVIASVRRQPPGLPRWDSQSTQSKHSDDGNQMPIGGRCYPPNGRPTPAPRTEPASIWETSVVTIFLGKGSDSLSNASDSRTRHWMK